MAEFTRLGPVKAFIDVDENGDHLDHWEVVNLTFTVRCVGADGQQHYQSADTHPELMIEFHESVFSSLEHILKNQMIEAGTWIK